LCGSAAAVAAASIAACSASGSSTSGFGGGSGQPEGDSGGQQEDSGSFLIDSSVSDAAAETAPPPPATVTFVHASPSLNDTRLCWTVPAGDAGALTAASPFPSGAPMPASNFPGLPVGGAVQLSPATGLAAASASGPVELYAIDAEVLAREDNDASPSSCEALVCLRNSSPDPSAPCLRPNKDYWHAGTIPTRAIAASGPTLVALAGCEGTALDPAASALRCGPDWDPVAGNLHVEVLHVAAPLSRAGDAGTTRDAGVLRVQSALLSPALAASLADAAAHVSFGPQGEAGAVASLSNEDDVQPATPLAVGLGTGLAAFGQLGFGIDALELDAATSTHFWTSLAQAQSLVDPTVDPRVYFGIEATYVVAVVGDPGAPSPFSAGDASYDGRGLHLLVLASLPAN